VLPPQTDWQSAAAVLQAALSDTAKALNPSPAEPLNPAAAAGSGVLRWEVPLPRSSAAHGCGSGFTALQWLQGQEGLKVTMHQAYFSGRHSTAPDTPGTAAAEAAAQGWGAVAGLGAAWLWQGPAGRAFDGGVMAGLQRFLSEAQPRLRVLGGSRWVRQC
jgi:isochorismate synthase/2-succinyl-5-enolpyruvyl-6-hydroxy-3-cyclohexene-1-carboxylate synthase/2-succinyl-6-hydroxy-2,4-cyclohexadiene-1-carboxylate synthase/O-succinylbenzoate synthase